MEFQFGLFVVEIEEKSVSNFADRMSSISIKTQQRWLECKRLKRVCNKIQALMDNKKVTHDRLKREFESFIRDYSEFKSKVYGMF